MGDRIAIGYPENGYESPLSIENQSGFFGNGTPRNEERRRTLYKGKDNETEEGAKSGPPPEENVKDNQQLSEGDGGDDGKLEKYGIRDRIGCYTWTWFTMTMATGGIANVLHSSKKYIAMPNALSDFYQFRTAQAG